MIRDEHRLGSLFTTPPASEDEALERMQVIFEDPDHMAQARNASKTLPANQEEVHQRLEMAKSHPTNLVDLSFNSSEEFCQGLKHMGYLVKNKVLPGFHKNASRRIILVTAEHQDLETKYWIIERDRPKVALVFYVRVKSTDEEWTKECNEAME